MKHLLRWAITLATHDYAGAWRVRQYWRVRHQLDGDASEPMHLPCVFCLHDLTAEEEPVWLWCVRPSRLTHDREGVGHYLGCDWGNR
jgi:hypothetical protein